MVISKFNKIAAEIMMYQPYNDYVAFTVDMMEEI